MRISINQPAFLPWLGYFDRIIKSDLHVILDHVQFEKNSFINRNKIRTHENWCWLTVPVSTKNRFGALAITDVEIEYQRSWISKHLRAIEHNYRRAAYFDKYWPTINKIYQNEDQYLIDLIERFTTFAFEVLEIKTSIIRSSEMSLKAKKSDLILEICQLLDAKQYISGPHGRDYLDNASFQKNKIDIEFHDYVHPTYTQTYKGFENYMCIIDLIMNHGEQSRSILLNEIDNDSPSVW